MGGIRLQLHDEQLQNPLPGMTECMEGKGYATCMHVHVHVLHVNTSHTYIIMLTLKNGGGGAEGSYAEACRL